MNENTREVTRVNNRYLEMGVVSHHISSVYL